MTFFSRDALREVLMTYGEDARSQIGQDALVVLATGGLHGGYFVEAGAAGGADLSNTYLLEKRFGWRGVLVEPARGWHDPLALNRPGTRVDHRALWSRSGESLLFLEPPDSNLATLEPLAESDGHARDRRRAGGRSYEVKTVGLDDLLLEHGAPTVVDYLSLDTEGSEADVLEGFSFVGHEIRVLTVEHNFVADRRERVRRVLARQGYVQVGEAISSFDDWYVCGDAAKKWGL